MKQNSSPTDAATPAPACPTCGAAVPAGAPAGLCPACLLDQGAETVSAERPREPRFVPPPIETVAALFPQLEIQRLIGAGGMGAVYQARQKALDRQVALKLLPADGAGGTGFTERFNRQARALARLNHPNIVAVHEFGQAEGIHFFVMEYVDGANLRQLERAGRLSPREALQIIPQICDALQYAHDEGVVHRDIKPENVLVDRRGRVKVADFGLAKLLDPGSENPRLTVEGQVMGTPHYMAPEQVERPLAVDHRADIYSLGVVFYEMLTGDLPLGRFPPPSRRRPDIQVDVRLDEVVLRALENDPERRYQQVGEVKSRLETIATTPESAPTPAAEPATPDRVRYLRWAGFPVVAERNGEREVCFNGLCGAVATAFVMILLGFLVLWLLTGQSDPSLRTPAMMALLTVFLGVRRTMNRPWDDEASTAVAPARTGWGRRHWHRVMPYLPLAAIVAFAVGWNWWLQARAAARATPAVRLATSQVAQPDPASGALRAALPGGGRIELFAITDPDATPEVWWRPDGVPFTNVALQATTADLRPLPQTRTRTFALQLADLPQGADGPVIRFDTASAVTSGGTITADGVVNGGCWPVKASFPIAQGTATMQVGLGLDPWHTIATHSAAGRTGWLPRRAGDPIWSVDFSRDPAEGDGGARLSYVFGPELEEWRHRLVAVDRSGRMHSASRLTASPIEGPGLRTLYTATFQDLPLEDLEGFELQLRPLHWIRFERLSLRSPLGFPAPVNP